MGLTTRVIHAEADGAGTAMGGTVSVGPCTFVGAYYQFTNPSGTPDLTITNLNKVLLRRPDCGNGDGIQKPGSGRAELVSGQVAASFTGVAALDEVDVTLFFDLAGQDAGSPAGGGGESASSAVTSVNDTASSVQLLAVNPQRKGFTIFNDSTVILYVLFGGGAASTTNFSVAIGAGGYFESPAGFKYTGRIAGVWASDASGAARITEFS